MVAVPDTPRCIKPVRPIYRACEHITRPVTLTHRSYRPPMCVVRITAVVRIHVENSQFKAQPIQRTDSFSRMIHGDLGTRNQWGDNEECHLGCGCPQEKHVQLLECRRLQPLWNTLTRILEALRGKPILRRNQVILLGWSFWGVPDAYQCS